MRVRGLKPINRKQFTNFSGVALHAGAWIETSEKSAHCSGICVAPHAGALVEV